MARAPRPQRGEIWLVRFDSSIGAEMRKLRPAVVANVDSVGRLPLRIVFPLTDWQTTFAALPWFVPVPGADAFQVKSVSEARFVQRIGRLTSDELAEVAAAIALWVGAS